LNDAAGTGTQVTVVIADDYPVIRRGVAAAVRRRWDMRLVGEAESGPRALALIRAVRPQVALVEDNLPELGGQDVLHELVTEGSSTNVLLFADSGEGREVQRAMAAGASGFLTKREPIAGICEAIRRAAAGERYLSREAEMALLDHLRRGEPSAPPVLTAREREILRLTAEGATSTRIGKALHLSESTVKNHQRHIYAKLTVPNAPAAVYRAMRQGILR
jgi:two-component system, NarL family, nitrate/nitrite response regulator NarL